MNVAEALIAWAQAYCVIGAVVALVFLTIGIDRIDTDARGAYAFRPLLIPGILLLWPLVLWRWLREEAGWARHHARYTPLRKAHGIAALLMAAIIGVTLLISLVIRQSWPEDTAPIRLAPPTEAPTQEEAAPVEAVP